MTFQNVGTFDAGIFSPNWTGTGRGGIPTMDAAGIASSGAFLVSELEKRDPIIRKPLTSVTYPRDIVIQTGGGWMDYASAMSVAYGMTGSSDASAISSGGANGLPVVQANMEKGLYKAHAFAAALRVMFQDMQRANQIGRSLDQMLQDGIRLTYDKHMEKNVYVGLEEYGTAGLVNHPDAVENMVATGAGGNTSWFRKTSQEILHDLNMAIIAAWANVEYDESAMPNHVLVPYEQYAHILNTPVSELANESILDYVQKNNVAVKNGKTLYIGGTSWCKGAGTGASDRMVVYVNHERFLKVDELVPLSRVMSAPNVTQVCYDTAYMANISEVQLFYPQTLTYWDGV